MCRCHEFSLLRVLKCSTALVLLPLALEDLAFTCVVLSHGVVYSLHLQGDVLAFGQPSVSRAALNPAACYSAFWRWWHTNISSILDAGGCHGALGVVLQATGLHYQCAAPRACRLPHEDKSRDVVLFNHALGSGCTLGLLEDGRRVAQRYVLVAESLKPVESWEEFLSLTAPDRYAVFRDQLEWEQIFQLLGMDVVHEAFEDPWCAGGPAKVKRGFFVLRV
mmetsp:Transcript_28094/g.65656  ORF Transcript_28094/g.65656 Transcript_28094/m.65656 type:complete len:221 (-) Transcript_28094:93-755(-)|eukprot:CAMPEP_0171063176 /NCGR_PEP_ID=MMETSP0766_2-20121228/5491_1 /TAXON_ID=439317 /ORGANISM="Gambierdiscus australes, Strain CAWD 149" /LENGTH=220 /DNA_ID=CAMNT_0011519037 /DNA_START=78 /DNA_END=740 /DNA_ORIENTATION=-